MSAKSLQNPPAAGEAAHKLLPIYRVGCDDSLSQRVDADGILIWRQIAKFHDRERAAEVGLICNGNSALVDGLRGARAALMCFWHHSPTKIEAEVARIDAAIAAAKGAQS